MERRFMQEVRGVGKMLSSKNLSELKKALSILGDLIQRAEAERDSMISAMQATGEKWKTESLAVLNKTCVLAQLAREAKARLQDNSGAAELLKSVPNLENALLFPKLAAGAEMSFDAITSAIRAALIAEDAAFYYWIMDAYKDYVIYQQEPRTTTTTTEVKLWKRSYSMMDGAVTFGAPTEVERQVIYVEKKSAGAVIRIDRGKVKLVRR